MDALIIRQNWLWPWDKNRQGAVRAPLYSRLWAGPQIPFSPSQDDILHSSTSLTSAQPFPEHNYTHTRSNLLLCLICNPWLFLPSLHFIWVFLCLLGFWSSLSLPHRHLASAHLTPLSSLLLSTATVISLTRTTDRWSLLTQIWQWLCLVLTSLLFPPHILYGYKDFTI